MPIRLISLEEEKEFADSGGFFVGIDFGTTHSCVALSKGGRAKVLPLLSSISSNCSLVKTQVKLNESLIERFKTFLDKDEFSQKAQEWTFVFLKKIKQESEDYLGGPILGAVLTVPAKFSYHGRSALQSAAKDAGIHVLRLLNEPTAAAIAYGQKTNFSRLIVVYDFGGGTFDATILRLENGVFQILASNGLFIGGNDIDQALIQKLGWPNNSTNLTKAQNLKESFSNPNFKTDLLSSDEFNEMVQIVVDKTYRVIQNLLLDLHLLPQDIHEIILVGGSSRLTCVAKTLERAFGHDKVKKSIDPDYAVALGAAIHAEALTNHAMTSRPLLLDIVPASLGIETAMGCVETIIQKYTPTPCSHTIQFSTFYDNQTDVLIHIVQGDKISVQDCRSLGKIVLRIPKMPRKKPKIKITFHIDDSGLLTVTAIEEISQATGTLLIDYASNL